MTSHEVEQIVASLRSNLERAEACWFEVYRDSVTAWNDGQDGVRRYQPGECVTITFNLRIPAAEPVSVLTPSGGVNLPYVVSTAHTEEGTR
jgi:hypothetical protein